MEPSKENNHDRIPPKPLDIPNTFNTINAKNKELEQHISFKEKLLSSEYTMNIDLP